MTRYQLGFILAQALGAFYQHTTGPSQFDQLKLRMNRAAYRAAHHIVICVRVYFGLTLGFLTFTLPEVTVQTPTRKPE